MTSVERLARLAAPSPTRRRRHDSAGDGLPCPVEPRHGAMVRLRASSRQYCPDQSHDARRDEAGTACFQPGAES